MSKYVIKNCPNYRNREVDYTCTVEVISSDCHNCTDCVMKRIVEKCKEDEKPIILDVSEEAKDGMIVGRMLLKKEILDMLDIEECE